MIGTFKDNDGNTILVTITGFLEGVEVPMVTDSPLILTYKPFAGDVEFFPLAISKIAKMQFLASSVDYFSEFETTSFDVEIRRNGVIIFTGKTTIYNNQEPLAAAPFPFLIEAYDEISEFERLDYSDFVDNLGESDDLKAITNWFNPFTVQNTLSAIRNLKIRLRMFYGLTYFEVAEKLSRALLGSFYVSDRLYFWSHDYTDFTTTRTLTDSAIEEPVIYAKPQAKRVSVNLNYYRDNLVVLKDEYTVASLPNSKTTTGYRFTELTGVGVSISVKLKGLKYNLLSNAAYDSYFADDNIEMLQLPELRMEIAFYWDITFEPSIGSLDRYVYYNFSTQSWATSSTPVISYETFRVSPISESEAEFEVTIPAFGNADLNLTAPIPNVVSDLALIGVPLLPNADDFDFKPIDEIPFQIGGKIEYTAESISVEARYTGVKNGGLDLHGGGSDSVTISRSINANGVDYAFSTELSNYPFQFPINGATRVEMLPSGTLFEAYYPSWANRIFKNESPFTAADFPIQNINETDDLIRILLNRLEVLLGSKISMLDVDLKADNEIYNNPFAPFIFDFGNGEKLFKIMEGEVNVRENIFSGTIHEILQ